MGLREWVTQFWVRYQGLLLELANFQLRDRDRAEEVVQDTWVDFLKSLTRFEGRCSPKTWLVQILRRRIKKELRRMILEAVPAKQSSKLRRVRDIMKLMRA